MNYCTGMELCAHAPYSYTTPGPTLHLHPALHKTHDIFYMRAWLGLAVGGHSQLCLKKKRRFPISTVQYCSTTVVLLALLSPHPGPVALALLPGTVR